VSAPAPNIAVASVPTGETTSSVDSISRPTAEAVVFAPREVAAQPRRIAVSKNH
jgi:hypothetical protein